MRVNRRSVIAAAGISALSFVAPASASPESDAMKAVAQRFVDEVLTAGNLSVIDDLFADTYESPNPEDAPGREAYKTRLDDDLSFDKYQATDIKYSIENTAITGKNLLLRGQVTGISTQGKKINAVYFVQFAFADGLITSAWFLRDERTISGY